jgi:hypothetical protein
VRGWARPPCRHFKTQSCCRLDFEAASNSLRQGIPQLWGDRPSGCQYSTRHLMALAVGCVCLTSGTTGRSLNSASRASSAGYSSSGISNSVARKEELSSRSTDRLDISRVSNLAIPATRGGSVIRQPVGPGSGELGLSPQPSMRRPNRASPSSHPAPPHLRPEPYEPHLARRRWVRSARTRGATLSLAPAGSSAGWARCSAKSAPTAANQSPTQRCTHQDGWPVVHTQWDG